MEQKRSSFTGKLGFIMAAAGSAVGLGNIWRFPYLAAKYGGGIFLLVYVILAVTFGFALMSIYLIQHFFPYKIPEAHPQEWALHRSSPESGQCPVPSGASRPHGFPRLQQLPSAAYCGKYC